MGMASARKSVMAEVDEMLASGEITTFAEYQKLIRHPANPGVVELEGGEFEGELEEGEKVWLRPEDEALIHTAELELLDERFPAPDSIVERKEDEQARLERTAVARLAQLKHLCLEVAAASVPGAAGILGQQIRQVEKGLHSGGSSERQQASRYLRAHMNAITDREHMLVKGRQRASRKIRLCAHNRKHREKRANRAKGGEEEEKGSAPEGA